MTLRQRLVGTNAALALSSLAGGLSAAELHRWLSAGCALVVFFLSLVGALVAATDDSIPGA